MTGGHGSHRPEAEDSAASPIEPRPLIERLGLAAIAVLVTLVFGALGVAAFASNEVFLGVMGLTGALMTMWAAFGSLRRG
jgi:hypothetical protein